MNMRNLLALDQASKVSGYSVFIDGQLETFSHFTFDDSNFDSRLLKIRNKIQELIQQYQINEVVYEDIQMQDNVANNVQTFKALAEVYGIVGELCEELRLPHQSILASSWKSALGIKGKTRAEQKRNAQQYVRDQLNVKATQDESDSICIGLAHLYNSKNDWS